MQTSKSLRQELEETRENLVRAKDTLAWIAAIKNLTVAEARDIAERTLEIINGK